jgi:hypothetical protein
MSHYNDDTAGADWRDYEDDHNDDYEEDDEEQDDEDDEHVPRHDPNDGEAALRYAERGP